MKRCPFCGSQPEVITSQAVVWLQCRESKCGGTVNAASTIRHAIAAWNRRAK